MVNNVLEEIFTDFTNVICKIIEVYRYKGRFDNASLLFNSIEPLLDLPEIKNEEKANVLIQFAQIRMDHKFLKEFNYEEEINMLEKAQTLAELSNRRDLKANAIDLIGDCIYREGLLEGDFNDALLHFNNALSIRTRLDDKLGLSKSYFHLGLFHDNKKDSDDNDKLTALEYYQKGLDITIEGGYKLEQSYFYRHLGGYYAFVKDDLEKGLDYFIKSMELREEIGFDFSLQFAYFSVAFVYFLKNDSGNSKDYFLKAYSAAINVGRLEALRVLIFRRGEEILEELDSEVAKTYFTLLLEIANQLKDNEIARTIELKLKELTV